MVITPALHIGYYDHMIYLSWSGDPRAPTSSPDWAEDCRAAAAADSTGGVSPGPGETDRAAQKTVSCSPDFHTPLTGFAQPGDRERGRGTCYHGNYIALCVVSMYNFWNWHHNNMTFLCLGGRGRGGRGMVLQERQNWLWFFCLQN